MTRKVKYMVESSNKTQTTKFKILTNIVLIAGYSVAFFGWFSILVTARKYEHLGWFHQTALNEIYPFALLSIFGLIIFAVGGYLYYYFSKKDLLYNSKKHLFN